MVDKGKYWWTRRTLQTCYLIFIHPTIKYGSILYDSCSKTDSSKLEGVTGAKRGSSHSALYNELTGVKFPLLYRSLLRVMFPYGPKPMHSILPNNTQTNPQKQRYIHLKCFFGVNLCISTRNWRKKSYLPPFRVYNFHYYLVDSRYGIPTCTYGIHITHSWN